jgi:FRG domain-containing protein
MQEIFCKTAADFVERLRITHELWGGQPAWDWGFRGQGNADWNLLPSAFRDGTLLSYANATLKAPIKLLGDQHWCEFKLIQHFLYLADRVGLSVPGDAQHFRLPPTTDQRWTSDEWPQEDVLETLAIAQHHGVPTRLLDITHNALIAAFFAADDARDPEKVKGAERFGVWAVDLSMVRQAAAFRVMEGGKPRLIHVTAPRAGNSFLHNQDGLFLLDREASRRRKQSGRFETMDEVVDAVAEEMLTHPTEELPYYRPSPASPMVKITAPVALAMDVLDLLDRDFYNRARIMPTHDNVVKTLQFQRSLNDHRRTRSNYQAITYGPKFAVGAAVKTRAGRASSRAAADPTTTKARR